MGRIGLMGPMGLHEAHGPPMELKGYIGLHGAAAEAQHEAREIRTPNLLIWSQTRCRCAIAPVSVNQHLRQPTSGAHASQSDPQQ